MFTIETSVSISKMHIVAGVHRISIHVIDIEKNTVVLKIITVVIYLLTCLLSEFQNAVTLNQSIYRFAKAV